ncbi:hypothetical protein KC909_05180 [Candidatus Dojkabacteria bacterium]|uniref:UDP-N-acetylmuramate--L-alanine ligase n=1 Tax=Candidatus Dojkabacteria bacterium TaxID=2099670 RepID=A0A955L647_9BACT|nr:hypothetical protein [Candidatus Dojkabacteria bacterium]
MSDKKKWVHIIGISGVTTSGVAKMFLDLGWKVTGSDKGFFPPVSTFLEKNNLEIAPGYKAERLHDGEQIPDLVVAQGVKGNTNPEYVEAEKLGVRIINYPQVLSEYVIHPHNSIVVTGTYGKTTINSMLIKIFQQAEKEISYMVGGFTTNFDQTVKAKQDNTEYSIVEGDEYLVSLEETTSKFFKYSAKYLIVNAVKWDHPDMFPTEEEYILNFEKLVKDVPADGLIVANANDENTVRVTKLARCKVIYYSIDIEKAFVKPQWYLIKESKPLPTIVRDPEQNVAEIIPYEKQIIGDFNEENILAASVLSYELGIRKERIQEAIADFKGIKRRLEKRYENEKAIIVDDFGSSPPKAIGTLNAIKDDFPDWKIIAIFEPNTGNRTQQSLELYDNAFEKADKLILPRFTKLPSTDQERFNADDLATYLENKNVFVTYIPNDSELVEYLTQEAKQDEKTIIVFMGSHSFRRMIDKLVANLDE